MYRPLHPHPHTCICSSAPMLPLIHMNVLIPAMVLLLAQSSTPSCSVHILPLVQMHLQTPAVLHLLAEQSMSVLFGHSHALTCHCDACYEPCTKGPCYGSSMNMPSYFPTCDLSLLLSLRPFNVILMPGMPVSRFPLSSQMLLTVQSASNLTPFLAEDPFTYSSFCEGEY